MMRVAIIGYPGSGRTTLANALAGVSLTRPIRVLDDLWTPLHGGGSLVLDGIPSSVRELEEIDAKSPAGRGIDQVVYLQVTPEIRLERIARTVIFGADPAAARDRLLHPADLNQLREHLEDTGRLIMIDAGRSRTEVLTDTFDALTPPT